MPAPRKYPDELRERAVRLVLEARAACATVFWSSDGTPTSFDVPLAICALGPPAGTGTRWLRDSAGTSPGSSRTTTRRSPRTPGP